MTNKYALITGASGLLGTATHSLLVSKGYTTIGLQHTRPVETDIVITHLNAIKQTTKKLDLVINLAGAPIAKAPWSAARKQILLNSRVEFTDQLVSNLRRNNIDCVHFISGSAIGFYGIGDQPCNESASAGNDFSAELCQQWEAQAMKAVAQRITLLRTGLVLTPNQGFLAPLTLPTKLGLGMVLGNGHQMMSWIDLRDWVSALSFIIDQGLSGPINMTAPNPLSHLDFMTTFAKSLNRKVRLKVPAALLRPLGEMRTLLIDGQSVFPAKLLESQFEFKYDFLEQSLNARQ